MPVLRYLLVRLAAVVVTQVSPAALPLGTFNHDLLIPTGVALYSRTYEYKISTCFVVKMVIIIA